jgi:hypothetical protein
VVSVEFQKVVQEKNVLRTRIILKDSMLVDPTFHQFDEMLRYAKDRIHGIIVAYDGEPLEMNSGKWNEDTMNYELTQLVNNFSERRITHLKEIISHLMRDRIEEIENQNCFHKKKTESEKKEIRMSALREISSSGLEIKKIMEDVKQSGAWNLRKVCKMQQAAEMVVKNAELYKNNK